VVLSVGIMLLRRIPAILALYKWIPEIATWKEALFSGHFGPMGVGAVFISTLAIHRLPSPQDPPVTQQDYLSLALEPIVSFIVFSSIIVHGLSIPFFNLGRNISRNATLTRTLTNPLRTPDWLLGTNRNVTESSDVQYVENTASFQRDIQSKQSHSQVSAVSIDIREPSTAPEQDIEAGRGAAAAKLTRPVSAPAYAMPLPSHGDTTPDSTDQPLDALEINTLLGQPSGTNPSKGIIEDGNAEVTPSNRPKVVQFSTG